jgi:phosphate/sulfate permease
MDPFLLMILVIVVAVVFEYINGFHDAANAIATVVSTRVLTPRQAIMLAAVTNLFGAFWGTAVAKTIYSGYIDMAGGHIAIEGMQLAIACGLMGGIVWNLITWWFGIPSSSSHALIGGLCGGVLGLTHLNWQSLIWSSTDAAGKSIGLWPKLIKPMVISPFIGFTLGVIFMMLLTVVIVRLTIRPSIVSKVFGKLQLVSAGLMGFSHGSNDAQKTVGIITFALIVGVGAGAFDPAHAPDWAQWLKPTINAKGGVDKRTVLRLDPRLSPVKAAVLPLSRNADLSPVARELAAELRRTWNVDFDDAGAIGRRYRRQDEIGTPFCVTVDFDTLEDRAVTVRERDSMAQERIPLEGLRAWLAERLPAH